MDFEEDLMMREDYPQMPGKFNWGAFLFCLPWGIGNHCYITLLSLVPVLNIVIMFLAGFKGNQWAMEKNNYRDMEEFSRVQETWNKAGKVMFMINLVLILVFILLMAAGILTSTSLERFNETSM